MNKLVTLTRPSGSLWERQTTGENRLVASGGGCPLEVDGEIGSTVGVDGGGVAQDVAVAGPDIEHFDELGGRRP